MGKEYVIGVDGGGTKTHYALFDTEGSFINLVKGGPTTHKLLQNEYDSIQQEIDANMRILLERYGLKASDIAFCVLGLSGVDMEFQHTEVTKRLKKLSLGDFRVYNDVFLGLKAGSEKGFGICCNNGTGICCAGIDKYGHRIQIGGGDRYTDEDVSGSSLGITAIRIVYRSIFKCGAPTIMKQMLFDLLEVKDETLFLDAVYEKVKTGKIEDKVLSSLVFNAANQGDDAASEVLRHAGRDLAGSVLGAASYLCFPYGEEIDIVISGSTFVKGESPIMRETFKAEVIKNIGREVHFHLLREPPVAGAIIWALEELTNAVDRKLRNKVLDGLHL